MACFGLMLNSAVFAGTFNAFGPENYRRESGPPVTVTKSFSVRNPSTTYKIQIYNGGMEDGEFERVSSSVITLNGVQIVGPSEFNQNVSFIEKPVALLGANELSVELRGKPGGGITIRIVGVDNDLPTIVASVNPPANQNGWHSTNVTVSFICDDATSGVAFCPSPTTLTTEGASQTITGTATDNAGNSATAGVSINLDKTPPAVTVDSPASGQVFTAPDITVTGAVNDLLSGVTSVTCNGLPASVSGPSFTCPITLVAESNVIFVLARDLAGNAGSALVTVTLRADTLPPPASIRITPGTMTLLVGETREMEVVDELGRPRSGVSWTVSNPAVLEVTTATTTTLKALAAGEVTLSASLQGQTAQAHVTVFAGTALPPGTVRWSVEPAPDFVTARIVQAQPAENAPDVYAVETSPFGGTLVRALSIDGRQRWQSLAAAPSEYLVKAVSDTQGGLLLQFQGSSYIIRLDPVSGQQSWRYDSPGQITLDWAVHPDGSIYFVEFANDYSSSSLVALHGDTGAEKLRVPIPRSASFTLNTDCFAGQTFGSEFASESGPPMIAPDGSVYLQVSVLQDYFDYEPCGIGSLSYNSTLSLWKILPDGSLTTQPLQTYSASGFVTSRPPRALPAETIPDGSDGLLAAWTRSELSLFGELRDARMTRVLVSGATAQYSLPFYGWPAPQSANVGQTLVLGEDGTAFATDQSQVLSFDLATGAVRWSWQPAQGPVEMIMATAGNGLVAKNRDGNTGLETVVRLDSFGVPTYESWSNPAVQHAVGDLWLGQGSLVGISASEVAWPDSGIRGAEPVIRVHVYKITEANIDDALIRSRVGSAIEYWQKKAGILMDWDKNILPVPACAEDRPGCIQGSNPAHEYDISSVTNTDNVAEALRRFRSPRGVNFLFVYTVGFQGTNVDAGVPRDNTTGEFTNLVLVSRNSKDVLAHEMGHVFQLVHVSLRPFNLMYGSCPVIPFVIPCLFTDIANALADSNSLNESQIDKAKATARKLEQ
ncbi:MAG: Ig-like domain-containing protein [Acidobacteria bacterium]|nr:Ig-like domain-containing protein [Acidobacteriota bacterium]